MSNRRKARYHGVRQRGWRRVLNEIEIDEPLTWDGTRRIVSRERRAKRKRTEEKKINHTTDKEGEEGSANNNNKQRYRRGLMLILIDRAIYDPDFNFGRDARTLLSHNRTAWIIQAEIIMCARAIIIQVKYNYTKAGRERVGREQWNIKEYRRGFVTDNITCDNYIHQITIAATINSYLFLRSPSIYFRVTLYKFL